MKTPEQWAAEERDFQERQAMRADCRAHVDAWNDHEGALARARYNQVVAQLGREVSGLFDDLRRLSQPAN